MPYLKRPRLHFAGRFEADVSTVNNDPLHFDSPAFKSSYDDPQDPSGNPPNGWWNPTGTGDFNLLPSCQITAVCYQDGTNATAATQDPAVGMTFACTAGKLVDLDSQQQMVSQIFGLGVVLTAPGGTVVSGNFAVAPFTDIYAPFLFTPPPAKPPVPYSPWLRIPAMQQDEAAGAVYQSQLVDVAWNEQVVAASGSTFLAQLLEAAGSSPLSIRFNVDAFVMEAGPFFPTGRVVGTIGVAEPDELQHLTRGRQLFSLGVQNAPPGTPVQYNYAVALADFNAGKVIVDLGNALPSNPANPANPAADTFIDNGRIAIGYTIDGIGFSILGEVPYTGAGWYQQTAGIVDLPADRVLGEAEFAELEQVPLQLVTFDQDGNAVPQAQEAQDGTHVRADDFVLRMSPGDVRTVTLSATRFGAPLAGATISLVMDNTCMQSQQSANLGPGPAVGTPPSALSFPPTVTTGPDGTAQLTIEAGDPGTPRAFADGGFIDGQVYGIRPVFSGTYSTAPPNLSDFISILLWSGYSAPDNPTWADVQPIFLQYANLYPTMKQIIDLSDYTQVQLHADDIASRLQLDENDPLYMPVTRDLSPAKKNMIVAWIAAGCPA